MRLTGLDITGFKSFAKHVHLQFNEGNTAIVGPNGSGKSNIADAIRWVLGEQSMKTLRGKKLEDVIYSGGPTRGRLGMAEVSLTLENDNADDELSEVVITRRLFRSGESAYLVNNRQVRLSDVNEILAKAGFAQKTYTVIGQGMADSFVNASPVERRAMFEDATGVTPLLIKKEQTERRLEQTKENLTRGKDHLSELEPRLRSLKRSAARARQREEVEKELRNKEELWFSGLWHSYNETLKNAEEQLKNIEEKIKIASQQIEILQPKEESAPQIKNLPRLKEDLKKLRQEEQELAVILAQQGHSSEVVVDRRLVEKDIEEIAALQDLLIEKLDAVETLEELNLLQEDAEKVRILLQNLQEKIKKMAPEAGLQHSALAKRLEEVRSKKLELAEETENLESILFKSHEERQKHSSELDKQRNILHSVEQEKYSIEVSAAGTKARMEDTENQIRERINSDFLAQLKNSTVSAPAKEKTVGLDHEIFSLRRKIEQIGGIDPNVIQEETDVEQRVNELNSQVEDLEKASADLKEGIKELDRHIHLQFSDGMRVINENFNTYFRQVFGGGKAGLSVVKPKPIIHAELDAIEPEQHEHELPSGVEIKANPPGKKLSSIAQLSGGEKALTSVALLFSIIALRSSPFIVLDEVDAALDEANSRRFAHMIKEFSGQTQFLTITHNRSTMEASDSLYGITMSDEGISQLLSVRLNEVPENYVSVSE